MTVTLGPIRIGRVAELDHWPFPPAALFPTVASELSCGADVLDLSLTTRLVRTTDLVLLVDTGNGKQRPTLPPHHMFATDHLDRLAATGIRPEYVDVVVPTHLHPDRCGGNTRPVDGSLGAHVPAGPLPVLAHRVRVARVGARRPAGRRPGGRAGPPRSPTACSRSSTPGRPTRLMSPPPRPSPTASSWWGSRAHRGAPRRRAVRPGPDGPADGGHRAPSTAVRRPHARAGRRRRHSARRRALCDRAADTDATVLPAHSGGPTGGRITRRGSGLRFTDRSGDR